MAVKNASAKKRHKQSEDRRLRNKAVKSATRTSARKFVEAVHVKDQALASEKLGILLSELDKAGKKGVIKPNAVSRKKSRMMKLYNASFKTASAK
ncbi:MAG TPA: 30S ribosomal protein S20 [Treponemataceae bacterium]|nr:30S ribosomal protein S20 [Treponemataceae bacterium]